MECDIQIKKSPLLLEDCARFVKDNACGGTSLFVGHVRDQTSGKNVLALEFEAYVPMAIKELEIIVNDMARRWKVRKVSIHHRIGHLAIGETAVIIATSAPHRAAAFSACQYAIDTLKETVPIWKKEIFDDGEIWVAAHP